MKDDFENHLKSQPLRRVPPDWKAHILRAAREASQPAKSKPQTNSSAWEALVDRVHSLLWPSPVAWGTLAVIWLLLLCVGLIPRAEEPAVRKTEVSAQQLEMARQQRAWVRQEIGPEAVALLGPQPARPAVRPSPRSEAPDFDKTTDGALVLPRQEATIELA